MKPTLLLYGNCQAAALSVIFAANPAIADAFNVRHIANFDDRIPDSQEVADDAIAATTVFFDQHDAEPFSKIHLLPDRCIRVSYPSIDFNLLWPLNCLNIFNQPPTPEFPWGQFPYGDRVVVDAVKGGASADEVLAEYKEISQQRLPNLSRFAQLEFARLQARDAKCDVTIADYVISKFREKNLFWAVNHPTGRALEELGRRLLVAVSDGSEELRGVRISETIAKLDPEGPLGFFHTPVHPAVAEHFGLRWYPYGGGKDFGIRGHRMSYDDYYSRMIELSVRERDARLDPSL